MPQSSRGALNVVYQTRGGNDQIQPGTKPQKKHKGGKPRRFKRNTKATDAFGMNRPKR